ncbi:Complexin, partial [Cryptotermes secundus]
AVGGDDDGDDKEKEEEAERERQEAIREAEERRKEKHRKMEEEREKMRQEIRDKYNIKKKEEVQEQMPQEEPNPLMRKKKTPEELAREAEAEEEDEFTSKKGSGRTPHNTSSHPASGDSSGIGRTGLCFHSFLPTVLAQIRHAVLLVPETLLRLIFNHTARRASIEFNTFALYLEISQ